MQRQISFCIFFLSIEDSISIVKNCKTCYTLLCIILEKKENLMLSSSLSYILIRSFPESILLILAGYILFNLEINIIDVLKDSILYLIILTFIRIMPISFGIHTVLSMFVIGIIFYKLKKQPIITTILNIANIYICLAISEGIYIIMANCIFEIPTKVLTANTSVHSALLALPSLLIFILLITLMKLITKKLNRG